MKLQVADLADYARGCAFLGTGGGGEPYIGQMALQQEMLQNKQVRIIQPEDLNDDDLLVDICGVGATSVSTEKLLSTNIAAEVVARMEKHLGRKITALVAAEIGGINAAMPLIVSAQTGLPVVDGDGMGRAFPQFEQCTFSIYGCSASPAVLMNDDGDCVIIETDSDIKMEKIARDLTVTMGGGSVTVSSYPMSGKQVKKYIVPRTQSLALEIGRTISKARESNNDPFDSLSDYFGSKSDASYFKVLFDGKITDLNRSTQHGFTVGKVIISAHANNIEKGFEGTLEVTFQNENLVAYNNGHLLAIVPDLIVILDRETAEPITTDGLKYGQRVKVVGLNCSPLLRTAKALEVVGPAAFKLAEDYQPIESIHEQPLKKTV